MEFSEAKEKLKQGYISHGFELVDESKFRVRLRYQDSTCVITREDIQEYADFENRRSEFQVTPVECSICSKEYREHVVSDVSRFRRIPLSIRLRKENIIFGEPSSEAVYVEIGLASKDFINFFRFEKWLFDRFRIRTRLHTRRSEDIRELLFKPLTVRVHNLSESHILNAVKRSSRIIENCLFQLSYLKDITLWLMEEWPYRRMYRAGVFRFGDRLRTQRFPLSEINFDSDIIRLYQFGMSTNIPELQFLAFYQVLEYFFVSISNEKLYEKLSTRIKDPRFSLSNSNLDRLVQEVIKQRHETDETEMLKNVLNKFVDEKGLIEFIEAYEKHLGENIYSKRHNVFGVSIEVRLQEGHVIGNVAKHIKEIRNALVHSTDRYERRVRHIPFTKTTKKIEQDIPLMKFLAERVIIASAK